MDLGDPGYVAPMLMQEPVLNTPSGQESEVTRRARPDDRQQVETEWVSVAPEKSQTHPSARPVFQKPL
ncbi:hypothetical protein N7470_001218 [Penicillium chermesinum]|nr:hypothetical protein N7470_001218 [Penicillium chermesinum]